MTPHGKAKLPKLRARGTVMQEETAGVDLPFVDEHARGVAATPEAVWAALAGAMAGATGGALAGSYARAIRSDPDAPTGTFPSEGSAIPGFRVARADPPRALVLAGRHRFSTYVLAFRLQPTEGGRATRIVAVTRAAFPGVAGRAYRLAVIGTRGHAVMMRRILREVARRAERAG